MDISAGLIAKAATGAAAASATVAGIIFKDELGSLFFKSKVDGDGSRQGEVGGGNDPTNQLPTSSGSERDVNLTQWDSALIGKAENPGIQFVSNPANLKNTFDDDSQTITTSLSVSIKDNNLPDLKSKNNNKDWTWECEITFKKENTDKKELKEDLKEAFGKFLEKIKTGGTENKDLKIEFIKKCSGFRGSAAADALKNLNDLSWPGGVKSSGQDDDVIQEDNKIKSEKIFTLAEDGEKLKIKDDEKDEFDQWFSAPN